MEILRYTDEHHAFRERLRSFLAGEVTPFAGRWEEEKIVPKRKKIKKNKRKHIKKTIVNIRRKTNG